MRDQKQQHTMTPEQQREDTLKEFYARGYGDYDPVPTYGFQVGDHVTIGFLQDVVVCDIVGAGVYEIDYTSVDNNYGELIIKEHLKRFVHWYDIRPLQDEQPLSIIRNEDLQITFFQSSLQGGILHRAYYFGVDLTPEYQRDYVWEMSDKENLLDSIFNCVDIGKFVFVKNKKHENANLYTVLDGKQRIRTVLDYYENRFPYKGLYFNDLCVEDQNFFENYPIAVAEVQHITEEQVLRYFLKLNRCGKTMDENHLKKVELLLDVIYTNNQSSN